MQEKEQPQDDRWSTVPHHPWHRFFARIVDMNINGIIYLWVILLCVLLVDINLMKNYFSLLSNPYFIWPDLMMTAFVSIFINAFFIGKTGRSLGKILFGIRVVGRNGEKIGFKNALRREFAIWVRGLGCGIPIVCLFTMYSSFQNLKKNGVARWDQDFHLKIEYKQYNKNQKILMAIGLVISLMWFFALLESFVRHWVG